MNISYYILTRRTYCMEIYVPTLILCELDKNNFEYVTTLIKKVKKYRILWSCTEPQKVNGTKN